jgi:hypothetical protein
MVDTNLAAVCGLFCGTCEHLNTKCKACKTQQGKPFWTTMMNVESCPLYDCCANTKKLDHCGLCSELPCETFQAMRDPSLSDEEAEKSLIARQNELLRRKETGTEQWLKEKEDAV